MKKLVLLAVITTSCAVVKAQTLNNRALIDTAKLLKPFKADSMLLKPNYLNQNQLKGLIPDRQNLLAYAGKSVVTSAVDRMPIAILPVTDPMFVKRLSDDNHYKMPVKKLGEGKINP